MKLNQEFYQNHVTQVARNLIGKKLVFGSHQGIITETEAYRGNDDAASHAFSGPTNRSKIMFGQAGYSYVYLIYGMYNCLNITAETEGQAAAVLIRGLILIDLNQDPTSIFSIKKNSPTNLNGPGKICKYLGITREHSGINMSESDNFYVEEGIEIPKINITPRIGITKATDFPWRFVADLSAK